jgi:Tol biopolymer transport system component
MSDGLSNSRGHDRTPTDARRAEVIVQDTQETKDNGDRFRRSAATMICLLAACSAVDQVTGPAAPSSSPAPFVVAATSQLIPSEPSAYFSLPPASLPNGTTATIRVLRNGTSATVPLVDGGFDPVALHAIDGDTVAVTVDVAGRANPLSFNFVVPKPGPPIVIRTDPAPHKRDVPLNANVRVVFSEPIDATTLTSGSILLRAGGDVIDSRVAFADPDHAVVELAPAVVLKANVEYELVVTQSITDVAGNALAAPVTVPFTTGETTAVSTPVATMTISPLSATIAAGSSLSLSATTKDGEGLVLKGRPVSWSTDLPAVATVTAGGVVTGNAAGTARITATSEGIVAVATISVGPVPAIGQLAFVRNGQIFLVNSDGSGLMQLTDTPGASNIDPAWSPDGQRLAFASNRAGGADWDIYVMSADGSNIVRRTSGGYNADPAWSPDGRQIAFTSRLNGSAAISVVAADGNAATRVLLDRPGYDGNPAWSPDGRQITFSSDWRAYDIVYDLYAMNADGSGPRELLAAPFFGPPIMYLQSSWSPDGQRIAVGLFADDYSLFPPGSIAVVNADGSGPKVIAQFGGYGNPAWSPDGQTIAFGSQACAGCQPSVRFVRADGTLEGLIVTNGHSPAWRP